MGSNIEGGSGNTCGGKEADCSFTGAKGHLFRNGSCDEQQHAFCEASILYSENAANVSKLTASVIHNSSEDCDKQTIKTSLGNTVGDQFLPERNDVTAPSPLPSNSEMTPQSPHTSLLAGVENQQVPEHQDIDISCNTGVAQVTVLDSMDLDKEDTPGSTLSSLHAKGIKKAVHNETVHGYHHDCEIQGSVGQNYAALRCNEDNAGHTRGDSPFGSLNNTSPLGTRICTDHGMPSDETMKKNTVNEQFEKSSSLLEATNVPSSEMQPLPETDSESSEATEDDVKVCDICGDAGLEELLAVCSRCTDGAEHTYCMRKMLDELPEGDWLCEECKFKEETRNKEADKSEAISRAPKVRCSNEHSETTGTISDPTFLPKLVTNPMDEKARVTNQEQRSSQVSVKRHGTDIEVTSVATRNSSETSSGSLLTRRGTDIPHGNSFNNLDTGKIKASKPASSCGDPKNSQPVDRAQPSSLSHSSNVLAGHQSSRGPLSKSVSFNNSNTKPKVKHLTGTVPHVQKMAREYASSNTRKEGLVKEMARSTSLKSMSSGSSNDDSISKTQHRPRRPEDTKDVKVIKERNILEKRISIIDHPLVNPKPTDAIGVPFPNPDFRVAHASDSDILGTGKGSDGTNKLGCKEVIKQSGYIKGSRGLSSTGVCNSVNEKPFRVLSSNGLHANPAPTDISSRNPDTAAQHSALQAVGSAHRADKIKDPIFFSSSRQAVPCGSRILRCQRCNETGHSTQNCSIDKLRVTALKPSADRNLKDRTDKSSKWKDVVEVALSKTIVQKGHKLGNRIEKLPISKPDMNVELTQNNSLSISSCGGRDLPLLEGATDGQESSRSSVVDPNKTGIVIDGKPESVRQVGISNIPRARELNLAPTISDEITVKPILHFLPDQASILASPFKAPVIPELPFIWQGGFKVLRTGKLPELCEGIQAHLSTSASPKVLEVATKFPCQVQLDEVPRLSSWPLQFQGNRPNEDNIALFFFAKDTRSYEENYRILLENMVYNDLVLKGNIDGIELLIFPSNTLPTNYQSWNRLFFLWGVFRGRRKKCLEAQPYSLEKPGASSSTVQPLPSFISDGSTSENQEELPMSDSSKTTRQLSNLTALHLASKMDKDVACLKNLNNDSEGGKDTETRIQACTSSPNQDGGAIRSEKDHKLIKCEVVLNDLQEVTAKDYHIWDSGLNRKRANPDLNSPISDASDDTLENTCETIQYSDKSTDGEKGNKKMKLDSGPHASLCSEEESSRGKVSSKFNPLSSSCSNNGVYQEIFIPAGSSAERHFIPVDLDPVKDTNPDSFICVISSDDEDSLEPNIPDLELALGGEKNSPKQDLLPLLSPRISESTRYHKVPSPSKNIDDGPPSLSLSLTFPSTE